MGLLRPGDRLPPEARLAEDLGISPVTLRSALTILRSAGLIETQRGRSGGTFVAPGAAALPLGEEEPPPAETDLRDLADFRSVVEGGAAALAAERTTPVQLAELERLAAEMEGARAFEAWGERDTLFHLIVADASGSRRLVEQVAAIRADVFRISRRMPAPRPVRAIADGEHRELLAAIRAGDPEGARRAMAGHVESTLALWLGLGRVPGRRTQTRGIAE